MIESGDTIDAGRARFMPLSEYENHYSIASQHASEASGCRLMGPKGRGLRVPSLLTSSRY